MTDNEIIEILSNLLNDGSKRILNISSVKSEIDINLKNKTDDGNSLKKTPDEKSCEKDISYDIIFGNLVFMRSNDDEIGGLVDKALGSLEKGGYFLFRESCFHVSPENPTEYKSPTKFIDIFRSKIIEENNKQYGFDLVFARPSRTYSLIENNRNQIYFLFKKVDLINFHGSKTVKEYYENLMYKLEKISFFEQVFDYGFISPGGRHSSDEFLQQLSLKKGQRVLDIGCGIGGADFMMAEKYGVEVFGLDLSSNMIGIAWERGQNYKHLNVHFEIGDMTKHDFPKEYFDVIYSREAVLHIENKKSSFERFHSWLKPGGKLFITDYCCTKTSPKEFIDYARTIGRTYLLIDEYETMLNEVGYGNVVIYDISDKFLHYTNNELKKLEKIDENLLKEFKQKYYDPVEAWGLEYQHGLKGYQKWVLFTAQKINNL